MMKYTRYRFASILLISLFAVPSVHASAAVEQMYTTGGIINVAMLLGALIGLIWSLKVMTLVKGGLMSKSWQMFSLGLVFLLLARVLAIGESVNAFSVPEIVPAILYLLMVFTWLVGIYQSKKILG